MKQIHEVPWEPVKRLGDNIWAVEWEDSEVAHPVKTSIVKTPKANQRLLSDFTLNPKYKR